MIFSPQKDTNSLLQSLTVFEQYIDGDFNSLDDINNYCNNQHFKLIEQKVLDIANKLEKKNDESLSVYGEIMLSCEKLSDGFTYDRITSTSSDPKLNYIASTLNTMFKNLNNAIDNIMLHLNEYSNLNYMNTIDETLFRGGELRDLIKGINVLKDEITKSLSSSHRESMVLEHEAQVLKSKAELLSKSTQQQSVALEETAAAVVEISSNINSNMQSAQQMLSLGNEVKSSTIKGEELSSNTLKSMDEINESTNKVYDAIAMIDQIAFQTNILSLNAAVEAATAGEAGKGFAVVAQEVRNLASRSADAAKEIGTLMDQLKDKATLGKSVANDMKDDYQGLNDNIAQTVELIETMVSANKEQSIGIAQVEDALNEIDKAVQQNSSVSDDVSTISSQVYNVSKKILETSNQASFIGKEEIEIRMNALSREHDNSNKSMRK